MQSMTIVRGCGLLTAGAAIAVLAGCGAASGRPPDPAATAHAVLSRHPVVDGHNDLARHYLAASPPWSVSALDIEARLPGQSDVPRLRSGAIGATFVTVASDLGPGADMHRDRLLAAIDWFDALTRRHEGALMKALAPDDLVRAQAGGRIAMIMAIESGDQLDGSLEQLRELHARGLRAVTLVYDHHNALGDGAMVFPRSAGAARPPAGGLTPFGRQVVEEMNRLGMLIDLSHAAESTATDAMAVSRSPVMFSHSNARALTGTARNVSDETLRAVAANGGVVMVSFVPYLASEAHWRWWTAGEARYAELVAAHGSDRGRISAGMKAWDAAHPQPRVTLAAVADHIEHVARVAGDDHVGIGSDFDGMDSFVVAGLEDATGVPALFAELARRGWSEDRLAKLARGNFLRVWRTAAGRRAAGAS